MCQSRRASFFWELETQVLYGRLFRQWHLSGFFWSDPRKPRAGIHEPKFVWHSDDGCQLQAPISWWKPAIWNIGLIWKREKKISKFKIVIRYHYYWNEEKVRTKIYIQYKHILFYKRRQSHVFLQSSFPSILSHNCRR